MSISKRGNMRLVVVEDDNEIGIEYDGGDIFINYNHDKLMIADHQLFDILKEFLQKGGYLDEY